MAWKAALHGAVWEVEGVPDDSGEGASVTVPVDGPAPARCGAFYFTR
jgi:hypothetical protein